MVQQMPGRGDGFPDMRRRTQRVDAGAEIKDLGGITTELSRCTIDISTMRRYG
jgi:hypothetical protein